MNAVSSPPRAPASSAASSVATPIIRRAPRDVSDAAIAYAAVHDWRSQVARGGQGARRERPAVANEILVSTKLNPPRLRRPIRRTRLLHELHSDEARRLVLVSAPPGAGKTSLLAEWVAADRS